MSPDPARDRLSVAVSGIRGGLRSRRWYRSYRSIAGGAARTAFATFGSLLSMSTYRSIASRAARTVSSNLGSLLSMSTYRSIASRAARTVSSTLGSLLSMSTYRSIASRAARAISTALGGLLAPPRRALHAIGARLAGIGFEVRVWNTLDPKDPQMLLLYLGESATLKQALLGLAGAAYLDLERGKGLELYARGGLRVTHFKPLSLWLIGVRQATLQAGRRPAETLKLALRLAAACGIAAATLAAIASRPGPAASAAKPCDDPLAVALAPLASRCTRENPCDVASLLAEGSIPAGALAPLSGRKGVVVAGFAAGRATVPERFVPVLANLYRAGGSCPRVLLVGRASGGGRRDVNLSLAASRAAAVAERLAASSPAPGAHDYVVLACADGEALPLDLEQVRSVLATAGVETSADPARFARFANQSVQVICAGCGT